MARANLLISGGTGTGKTTLLKTAMNLVRPISGDVLVDGYSIVKNPIEVKKRIGYLPEESYLYRFLNAEETLDFYGRLFKLAPQVRRERRQRPAAGGRA